MWRVINDKIKENCRGEGRRKFLFLERHQTLPLQWSVESFDPTYLERMDGFVTAYGTVSLFSLESFFTAAEKQGYEVVFMEDPAPEFTWLRSLSGPVGIEVSSDLPGVTEEGFLPCQAQGINFAKGRRATYLNWSTGLGKSVAMLGLIEWYIDSGLVDLILCFVKTNNKINTERGYERLWGLEIDPRSVIVDGSVSKRERQYISAVKVMGEGDVPILITNHEKLRDDVEALKLLVENRRVLVLWDEMSSKFGNHETKLYKAASEVFYTSHTVRNSFYPEVGSERTSEVYHVALSATPIEHNPGQLFNQFRMMDTTIYGSRRNFEHKFSRGRDPWGNIIWNPHKLPLIGLMALDAIHQIDKEDPDIAAQFPEVMPPETVYLTMSPSEAWLYDKLVAEYENMRQADASILDETEILAALNVLELICCNPLAVLESAIAHQQWMDEGGDPSKRRGSQVALKLRELVNNDKKFDIMSTKMLALFDMLEEDPTEKFVVFTSLNDQLIPRLSELLSERRIEHVTYHGGMTMKQKQASEDAFQNDPDVRVFLSSDAGSDSINLHAAAEVIHYNDPWSYAKKIQRQNRINRVVSQRTANRYRTLRFAGTYEDRKEEVIQRKEGYHHGILRGEIAEQAQQIRRGDFMYVLLGGDT